MIAEIFPDASQAILAGGRGTRERDLNLRTTSAHWEDADRTLISPGDKPIGRDEHSGTERCVGVVEDAPIPGSSRALAAWANAAAEQASDAVDRLEVADLDLPALPTNLWNLLCTGWSRTGKARMQRMTAEYVRPQTEKSWHALQAFREKVRRCHRKLVLVQKMAVLLGLMLPLIVVLLDAPEWTGLTMIFSAWILAAIVVSMASPMESLINKISTPITALDTDPNTGEVNLGPNTAAIALLAIKPQAHALFLDLWAALKKSSERSGVPLLRGDLLWAIKKAQSEPITTF